MQYVGQYSSAQSHHDSYAMPLAREGNEGEYDALLELMPARFMAQVAVAGLLWIVLAAQTPFDFLCRVCAAELFNILRPDVCDDVVDAREHIVCGEIILFYCGRHPHTWCNMLLHSSFVVCLFK